MALAASVAASLGSLANGDRLLVAGFLVLSLLLGGQLRWVGRGQGSDRAWAGAGTDRMPGQRSPLTRATRRSVTRSLGRTYARELTTSAWFGAGIGLCLFMAIAFAPTHEDQHWSEVVRALPFLAHALVGMVVVASHRIATSARRDDVAELIDSCPTSARVRRLGLLSVVWVPVAALAIFFVAYLAVVSRYSVVERAGLGAADVASLLAGLMLGVGGVALGGALARWGTSPLVPAGVVTVIGVASPWLATRGADDDPARVLVSTMPDVSDGMPDLGASQAWTHLLALIALTVAAGAIALLGAPRVSATSRQLERTPRSTRSPVPAPRSYR
jgi:hypothetical protein